MKNIVLSENRNSATLYGVVGFIYILYIVVRK
jgi:hypothetical protein